MFCPLTSFGLIPLYCKYTLYKCGYHRLIKTIGCTLRERTKDFQIVRSNRLILATGESYYNDKIVT